MGPFWAGFETTGSVSLWDFGIVEEAWGGGHDMVQAKDPVAALAVSMARQAELLSQVVHGSGIGGLIELRTQLQLAASEVVGSEFVHMPNARFRLRKLRIELDGSPVYSLHEGEGESVDLGRLQPYASGPAKRYPARRYFQETEKTFRFKMAKRTSQTRLQFGYRLRVGETDIPLVAFSAPGDPDDDLAPFPRQPIAVQIRETARVYDVRQSHVFSFAEEDLFEAGAPIPGPTSPYSVRGWSGRLFLNERLGEVKVAVDVRFEFDAGGGHFAGEAIVTIRNLDPVAFPHGVILPVSVFETHMNGEKPPRPQEYLADRMTVHLVPSFLVLNAAYFDAHWEAVGLMAKTIKKLDDRFGELELLPRRPDPDPAWAVRRDVLETTAALDTLDTIRSSRPEAIREVLQDLVPPVALSRTERTPEPPHDVPVE